MMADISMDMQEIIDVGLKEQRAATLAAQKEEMAAQEKQRAAEHVQFLLEQKQVIIQCH